MWKRNVNVCYFLQCDNLNLYFEEILLQECQLFKIYTYSFDSCIVYMFQEFKLFFVAGYKVSLFV